MSTLPTPHDDEQHHDVEQHESKQFGKVSTAAMNLGYSHGALHCLLVLDTYWRDKDRVTGRPKDDAYPGQQRLARELGVSRGTVQSYLNELAGLSVRGKPPKPAVIRKVRRGLGKTNVYVRLPQLRQHLRVVPPDAQPAVHPDAQPVAQPDAQPVVHKADEVEADEVEADEDKVKPTVGTARKKTRAFPAAAPSPDLTRNR